MAHYKHANFLQAYPQNSTEFKQQIVNQISHLNGDGGFYQITRKQKEQLEYLLS